MTWWLLWESWQVYPLAGSLDPTFNDWWILSITYARSQTSIDSKIVYNIQNTEFWELTVSAYIPVLGKNDQVKHWITWNIMTGYELKRLAESGITEVRSSRSIQ
jgi:hypothetical protein